VTAGLLGAQAMPLWTGSPPPTMLFKKIMASYWMPRSLSGSSLWCAPLFPTCKRNSIFHPLPKSPLVTL